MGTYQGESGKLRHLGCPLIRSQAPGAKHKSAKNTGLPYPGKREDGNDQPHADLQHLFFRLTGHDPHTRIHAAEQPTENAQTLYD